MKPNFAALVESRLDVFKAVINTQGTTVENAHLLARFLTDLHSNTSKQVSSAHRSPLSAPNAVCTIRPVLAGSLAAASTL
jgi:hypothetical protein